MPDMDAQQRAAEWLRLFHPVGQVFEVRALDRGCVRAVTRFFDNPDAAAKFAIECDLAAARGVYFTINPLKPDKLNSRGATRKGDVSRRHWLPCDIDPVRPAGTNSTEAEKNAAWNVAGAIKVMLDDVGFRGAVVGDSGNGIHRCYPIQLPNDDDSQWLLKKILNGIASRVDTAEAKLDAAVFDAPRIWKCYGTTARKGAPSDERPHRRAWIMSGEAWNADIAAANTPLLQALLTGWEEIENARAGRPDRNDPVKAARKYVNKIPPAVSGQKGHDACYHVACVLVVGFALTLEQAFDAIGPWNTKCEPPWSKEELLHKFESAARAEGVRGNLLRNEPTASQAPATPIGPTPSANGTHERNGRIILRANEITIRPIEWLWPGRIPVGKLTTFAGQTSQGKTFAAVDIAARVTRALPWPDGAAAYGQGGQVLFITGDDDADDTLVPRFKEAGADLSKVIFLKEKYQAEWTMGAISTLNEAIDQAGGDVRLVIIDPPTSFLGDVDDHKNSDLRALLTKFKEWASEKRLAVILITHVNKGAAQTDALARVMGSVAWVTGVRTAYMFCPDTEEVNEAPSGNGEETSAAAEPTDYVFLTLKNNLDKKARGLKYRIEEREGATVGRIVWRGFSDLNPDTAMRGTPGPSKKRHIDAAKWMVELFREKRSWSSDDFWKASRAADLSRSAVQEAKNLLNLPKCRKTTHTNGNTEWIWWVPDDWLYLTQDWVPNPVAPIPAAADVPTDDSFTTYTPPT
jgi:AAA domain